MNSSCYSLEQWRILDFIIEGKKHIIILWSYGRINSKVLSYIIRQYILNKYNLPYRFYMTHIYRPNLGRGQRFCVALSGNLLKGGNTIFDDFSFLAYSKMLVLFYNQHLVQTKN